MADWDFAKFSSCHNLNKNIDYKFCAIEVTVYLLNL